MPNHLDFLFVLDEHTRSNPSGCVRQGSDMHDIAHRAGLIKWGDQQAATWTGELVHLGYLIHGPAYAGDRGPDIPGFMWGDRELQRYGQYRLTPVGREEADRMRRHRRETATDAAVGTGFPMLLRAWMSDGQRGAVSEPLDRLREALDNKRYPAAIGAAKELVEAACKVVIEHAGESALNGASLPTLYKQARATQDVEALGLPLGNSLASTVQRLAELRNSAGTGHGRASSPEVMARDARIAASSGVAIAEFLLSSP